MRKVSAYISHGQIVVFNSAMTNPFNDWTEGHIEQGFAWRHGSVSFLVAESGDYDFELDLSGEFPPVDDKADRIIEVPFDVASEGRIEYGGIADLHEATIPDGQYTLRYEMFSGAPNGSSAGGVRLTLSRSGTRTFKIVKPWLPARAASKLITIADPAV